MKRITEKEIQDALIRVHMALPELEAIWKDAFNLDHETDLEVRAFLTEYNGVALEVTFWEHRFMEFVTRNEMRACGSAIAALRVGARRLRSQVRAARPTLTDETRTFLVGAGGE